MTLIYTISTIVLFVVAPFLISKFRKKWSLDALFSNLVLCFIVGIVLGNLKQYILPVDWVQTADSVANYSAIVPVLLAIPLLLMSSNIVESFGLAPALLRCFVLGIVSALVTSILLYWIFYDLKAVEKAIACMIGVYIGGTPNMMSVAYATQTPLSLYAILNTTDIVSSGIYFILLLSIGPSIFGLILKKSDDWNAPSENTFLEKANSANKETILSEKLLKKLIIRHRIAASICALIVVTLAFGIARLFPNQQGGLNEMLLMIVLTSSSIALSFHPTIRQLKGLYEYAQYLLLVFAVAIGFQANFQQLLQEGSYYLLLNALFVFGFVSLHLFLSRIFGIDRDSFIVCSTACVFGPPFIGQVCDHINNRPLIAAGMTLGILGLVLGTYTGILFVHFIHN